MNTAYRWAELFLNNSKAVGSVLFVLVSALGASTYTAVDQHQELVTLKDKIVIEVKTPEVKHVEPPQYNHDKMKKQINTLQREVNRLREWHK